MNLNRVTLLDDGPAFCGGRYVRYWMQQIQRVAFSPALEYGIACANERGQLVVVRFGLFDRSPKANERHFASMLEGLVDVDTDLRTRGIQFAVRLASLDAACLELTEQATLVVGDRECLRQQKAWRDNVARDAARQVIQLEGDVVVPVDNVSGNWEYSARTIRPKLNRLVESHLTQVKPRQPAKSPLRLRIGSDVDLTNVDKVLARLDIYRSGDRVGRFKRAPPKPDAVLQHSFVAGSKAMARRATTKRNRSARTSAPTCTLNKSHPWRSCESRAPQSPAQRNTTPYSSKS
ncbi:MAG: deoxyribodipyrimidine photo-lyase [Gammaproteobacteria bacterium]|jgi:deoxyribodipyrimidine photo-lyase